MGRPGALMKTPPIFSQDRSVIAPFPGTMSMIPSAEADHWCGWKSTEGVSEASHCFAALSTALGKSGSIGVAVLDHTWWVAMLQSKYVTYVPCLETPICPDLVFFSRCGELDSVVFPQHRLGLYCFLSRFLIWENDWWTFAAMSIHWFLDSYET